MVLKIFQHTFHDCLDHTTKGPDKVFSDYFFFRDFFVQVLFSILFARL